MLEFWSIQLSRLKSVNVTVPKGFTLNVQQAAIDGGSENVPVVIRVEKLVPGREENLITVVGTLRPGKIDQIALGIF